MASKKQLLIVDDTEIDRIILKSILCRDFDIDEANSGNAAFEYLTTKGDQLDAILLDIMMPNIDGFDVLRFMADKGITNIPVFLVTSEPTREHVEKAVQFNIAEFIGKPFDREDVLRRLRSRLGVVPEYDLKAEDLVTTKAYIAELQSLYRVYLANMGRTDEHYRVMTDLMRIMVSRYSKELGGRLQPEAIELIAQAAYFCDIGEMLVPDKRLQIMAGDNPNAADIQQNHTIYGSSLLRLNHDKACTYFVEICASMCLHHHERWDGRGYPDRLVDRNNSDFNQMCRIVDEFEGLRSKFYGDKARPVKFVMKRLANDHSGMVSPIITSLMEDCEQQIIDYFLRENV